jgi:hypothetical protein
LSIGDLLLAKLSCADNRNPMDHQLSFYFFHPPFLGSEDQKKKVSGLGEVHKDIHIWLEINYNACMHGEVWSTFV